MGNNLPTFIIIGAMKSGSSSLHNYLGRHPQVQMSDPKELNYFIEELNWSKGLDWYKSHFSDEYPVRGESSIGYTKCEEYPGVPERIHQLLPGIKMIYILREPVERAVSHFTDDMLYHQVEKGDYPDINEVFRKVDNKYISASKYNLQLEQYLKWFDKQKILIITTENLKSAPYETLSEVFEFIGASPLTREKTEEITSFQLNPTGRKEVKSSGFKKVSSFPLFLRLKKMLPESIATGIASSKFYRSLTKKPLKSVAGNLSKENYDRVKTILYEDVRKLKETTGKTFSEWQD